MPATANSAPRPDPRRNPTVCGVEHDVSRSRTPSETAFLSFYDATIDEVYRYAARLCGADRGAAEDLVQDSYLSVLGRYRVDGERTLTIEYVVTTVRHRFLDRVRSGEREERRLRLVHSAPDTGATDTPDAPEPLLSNRLAELPARDRAALVLRYVDDLSVPEVAGAMGLTVHATESLLVRARARLRGKEARDA